MKNIFEEFNKSKNFLVCIDSDGCAMDTMEIKHHKCFAPELIKEWNLFENEDMITQLWYNINLYSKTRGINRFKGLVKIFEELKTKGIKIENSDDISKWVNTSPELSNNSLKKELEKNYNIGLEKALNWSISVNNSIQSLPKDDSPFLNVTDTLSKICQYADIAVVSSANSEALKDEWYRHNLIKYIKLLLGQDAGTKSSCINALKQKGYKNDCILMVGDAPGDLEAAQSNDVKFYPILVGKEAYSWQRLATEAIPKFIDYNFDKDYQYSLIKEFNEILK